MAETLLVYQTLVAGRDGIAYEARACGGADATGRWQGWIEFVPAGGGQPLRSPRETTQPSREDTIYWATGLTPVYLEGALRRALEPSRAAPAVLPQPSIFDEPAPSPPSAQVDATTSVLDPFSVYQKGEALLRRQLAALSPWHLVNIAIDYELTDLGVETLNTMPQAELVELIVASVKTASESARTR